MTERHVSAAVADRKWVSTLIVSVQVALLAFVVIALGWQQWLYGQQREQVMKMISEQKQTLEIERQIVAGLTSRQDWLRQRQDELVQLNATQDLRIEKEFVKKDQYSCDVKDLKEAMKGGFAALEKRIDGWEGKRR